MSKQYEYIDDMLEEVLDVIAALQAQKRKRPKSQQNLLNNLNAAYDRYLNDVISEEQGHGD